MIIITIFSKSLLTLKQGTSTKQCKWKEMVLLKDIVYNIVEAPFTFFFFYFKGEVSPKQQWGLGEENAILETQQ